MLFRWFCVSLALFSFNPVWAADVALVMSVQGKVMRSPEFAPAAVEIFAKLADGERLILDKDARLQLVYFENGRLETWAGPGRLEIGGREARASGQAALETKSLPLVMARQLAHTPAVDSQGRVRAPRLRAVQAQDALLKLEDTYHELRSRAAPDDLGPEMYLLSGLYEMRELERVERVLGDLQQDRRKNPEAALLISLYRKAVKNARESRN